MVLRKLVRLSLMNVDDENEEEEEEVDDNRNL